MKKLTFEIKPKVGLGELDFGITMEQLIEVIGKPEEVEDLADEDDFNTTILNYWEMGLTAYYEGTDNSVLSCFETDNRNSTLFGKPVFNMKEQEILDLMKANGFKEIDSDTEEWGEKRISYDDAMLDFYFNEGQLLSINWGVLVNENGEIEEL